MLDKTYQPQSVEQRLYQAWEQAGAFRPAADPAAKAYTIALPPPNVTGSLHIGHALNHTLQDILIRYERMKGRAALWQAGTDHAGIATQLVVERQLAEKQTSRHAMGREAFVNRVWEWKAESGGTITRQQRRLGESIDWTRERFTMDEGLSEAVLKVFVELYREGLIYKDKRLVNWDPKMQTAVSDLEVESIEVKSHLWFLKYEIEGEPGRFITVATTRPETMLGDTGIAVHPEDERFKDLVGKFAILPLVGRRIPIVADDYSDPEKGTGAVKITPAHDFNDFEVGKRHNLEMINIFDRVAHLNENVPEAYRGLERFKARKQIVADLEALGLVEKIEPNTHMVPHDEKSKTVVIEPYLTEQWYVNAAVLAKPAIEAVEKGDIQFVPKNWEKTYFEWMRNIQPWCISRQLWWGHQIPAWYGPDGKVFVAYNEAEAQAEAARHYGKAVSLARDEDVLDTWFSSALWPFSTLGWPTETPEFKRHYPTDVLITGFDIIFFWVARMIMMGLHFTKQAPFHTVYIHALVRDEKGQKMSKTKGNVLDPLVLIEKFGADALRFALTAFAAQGRDVRMSEQRVEGYRNFATKLWNAARFAEMNGCALPASFDPNGVKGMVNAWILGRLSAAQSAVDAALGAYKFNEAAAALYQFTWGEFCDWYLELIKPAFMGNDEALKAESQATCAYVLKQLIHLLHPFMPYITEELWAQLFGAPKNAKGESFLMLQAWPKDAARPIDAKASDEIGWLIRLIEGVRTARSELNVPAAAKIAMIVNGGSGETKARLARHADPIKRLARIETLEQDKAAPAGSARIVLDEATLVLPLADVIDLAKERARLAKERDKADAEIRKIDAKLGDETFVKRAPPEVVEEQHERRAAQSALSAKLGEALAQLEASS